ADDIELDIRMRLGEAADDFGHVAVGFPALPPVQIGIMKRPGVSLSLMNAITAHITACLDNITPTVVDDSLEADVKSAQARLYPRLKAANMVPSW
ncbi:hypothetical protein ACCT19_36290, partial [Rhizobium ruizarguesonis]